MATFRPRSFLFAGGLVTTLLGCGSSVSTGSGSSETSPSPTTTSPTAPPPVPQNHYPGHGFVVHEWGTDTIVVGSDGSLQRGLHHEEEDLPGFVYDRIKAGSLPGSTSVAVKMETPVTYFYSDTARSVHVAVDFPKGAFTQWYPAVASFYPQIIGPGSLAGVNEYVDPVFDLTTPLQSKACIDHYTAVAGGMLDWAQIDILAPGSKPPIPDAPLDTYTWGYARNVAANALQNTGVPFTKEGPQSERFLFYRGLGNFDLPVVVTAQPGGNVVLANDHPDAIARAFVLNVGADRGAFASHAQGVGAFGSLSAGVPSLDKAQGLDAYADALAGEVTAALDATGLYHDEAVAMVSTWKRQWFKTPGVRVLYLAPQAWTDASIPLTITPAPDAMLRVMMIRVEVITPELEKTDTLMAGSLKSDALSPTAQVYFKGLGRFAEPRLRRALSLLGDPAWGQPFLGTIATAETRAAAGE
jgi:hypothetical protein